LQNPGLQAFLETELPYLRQHDTVLIVNIAGKTELDYCAMAYEVSQRDVDFIELNISCPNVKEGGAAFGSSPESIRRITREVKNHTLPGVPLMVKLSPNVASVADAAKAAEEGGADCISLINTITGMAVDAEKRVPLLKNVTGGLSGPCIKPVALRMVYEAYRAVKIPVVGMGGIRSAEDIAEFFLCGASAVQVGTANLADPMASYRLVGELDAYLNERGIRSVRELTGGLIV
jgi:dihydroorotate dehydrogenase (NAD+) catalytic subunit